MSLPRLALFIDVGNSRLKWAVSLLSPPKSTIDLQTSNAAPWLLSGVWDIAPKMTTPQSEHRAESLATISPWQSVSEQLQHHVVTWIHISHVGRNDERIALQKELTIYFQRADIQFFSNKVSTIFRRFYTDTLGQDRVAAALGAGGLLPQLQNIFVVNAGTATTLDIIKNHANTTEFHGGNILPGVGLMLNSLNTGTAQLNTTFSSRTLQKTWDDSISQPELGTAHNTADAIALGVMSAQIGAIAWALAKWQRVESDDGSTASHLFSTQTKPCLSPYVGAQDFTSTKNPVQLANNRPTVIVTGGWGSLLATVCASTLPDYVWLYRDNLCLLGLRRALCFAHNLAVVESAHAW